jgi:uncharacterized protein (TIGR03086 family)
MLIERAAAPLLDLIPSLDGHADDPTPCTEYTVRQLVNHLLVWGPTLAGAGGKQDVRPPAEGTDLTAGDWTAALAESVDAIVKAWDDPAAWEGSTRMGSEMEMPADLVGGMIAGELVVHGWDLARAAGRDLDVDVDIAEYLEVELAKTAELGRQMGFFGPEVAVPADAPALHRVLALTGRDPQWHRAPGAATPTHGTGR